MPFSVYLADPCETPSLSSSIVREILDRSPKHAALRHPRIGGATETTKRAELGTAAHAALLGGAERIGVVNAPDWKKKAARLEREALRLAGKIPILRHEAEALPLMVEAARETLAGIGIDLDAARCEHTAIWQENGLWCRARPDILAGGSGSLGTIIDYKTADNAEPGAWIRRAMIAGGYHVQGGWYTRAMRAVEPGEWSFVCLAGELEPPYACSLIGLGPELLDLANRQIEWALARWRECVERGEWPGYSPQIHFAEAPAWLEWECAARGIGAASASATVTLDGMNTRNANASEGA